MAVIEAIATSYLEADYTSVTFSSLGSYESLQLRIHAKTDRTNASNSDIALNFNGDTGTNYSHYRIVGSETVTYVDATTGDSYIKVSSIQSSTANSGAENYGAVIVNILDYKDDGNKNTTVSGTASINRVTASLLGGSRSILFMGMWNNDDDVTSIVLTPLGGSNFVRGSEFSLYGLKAAN